MLIVCLALAGLQNFIDRHQDPYAFYNNHIVTVTHFVEDEQERQQKYIDNCEEETKYMHAGLKCAWNGNFPQEPQGDDFTLEVGVVEWIKIDRLPKNAVVSQFLKEKQI